MARQWFLAFLGFCCVLLSRSLFSGVSYGADLCAYGVALYLLFYGHGQAGWLIGVTLGVELLGTARFGQGALLALVISILYTLLSELSRFTSRFARYMVAWAGTVIAYSLFFLTLHSILTYLPLLVVVFLAVAAISYPLASGSKETTYELI